MTRSQKFLCSAAKCVLIPAKTSAIIEGSIVRRTFFGEISLPRPQYIDNLLRPLIAVLLGWMSSIFKVGGGDNIGQLILQLSGVLSRDEHSLYTEGPAQVRLMIQYQ